MVSFFFSFSPLQLIMFFNGARRENRAEIQAIWGMAPLLWQVLTQDCPRESFWAAPTGGERQEDPGNIQHQNTILLRFRAPLLPSGYISHDNRLVYFEASFLKNTESVQGHLSWELRDTEKIPSRSPGEKDIQELEGWNDHLL